MGSTVFRPQRRSDSLLSVIALAVLVLLTIALSQCAEYAHAATFCWDQVPGAPWYNIYRGRMVYLWYSDPETGQSYLAADYPEFFACNAVPVPAASYCAQGTCCAQALDVAGADLALEFVTAFDPALPGSESKNCTEWDEQDRCTRSTLALVLPCP